MKLINKQKVGGLEKKDILQNGRIAWALWGGETGKTWSDKTC